MSKRLTILAIAVILSNTVYLVWLAFNVRGFFGVLLYSAEFLIFALSLIFIANHSAQEHVRKGHRRLATGSLDVFLPVVDEPFFIFEETLKAATAIEYIPKTVYVLDDGGRTDTELLAKQYGAQYLRRDFYNHRKAGNLNFGLTNSTGDFVLVLDADQVVWPKVARDLLGYFGDDLKLAMLTTRQKFQVPPSDFNNDVIFYEHMQAGKNADNAAISCGSGVIYRRAALKEIGGFQTWNVVEDLYTSFVLHQAGWRSLYVNRVYTLGLAPVDLPTIWKQRGTWALDTLRIFFRRSPLFVRGLTFRQRLHYFEIGFAYIASALAIPILFILPPLSLVLDKHVVLNETVYLLLRVPSLLCILYFYFLLSGRIVSICQFWASLFPVYLKALVLAFSPGQIRYAVTEKLSVAGKRNIKLILPHLLLIAFGLGSVAWRVIADRGVTPFLAVNGVWIVLMLFWFAPVIKKGLRLEYSFPTFFLKKWKIRFSR